MFHCSPLPLLPSLSREWSQLCVAEALLSAAVCIILAALDPELLVLLDLLRCSLGNLNLLVCCIQICRTFATTGTCPYGARCRFIHCSASQGDTVVDSQQQQLMMLLEQQQAEGGLHMPNAADLQQQQQPPPQQQVMVIRHMAPALEMMVVVAMMMMMMVMLMVMLTLMVVMLMVVMLMLMMMMMMMMMSIYIVLPSLSAGAVFQCISLLMSINSRSLQAHDGANED